MCDYLDRLDKALHSHSITRYQLRKVLTEPRENTALEAQLRAAPVRDTGSGKLVHAIQQAWKTSWSDGSSSAFLKVIVVAGSLLKDGGSGSVGGIPTRSLVGVLQTFASLARGSCSQKLLDVLRLEYAQLRRDAREDPEKKIGMILCLIEMIKICVIDRSANPGIVDSLLASTQGLLLSDQDLPKSVLTTFRFYVGKHKLFLDDFDGALTEMELAYDSCWTGKNAERILFYLIPLRMAKGVFPSKRLLLKFPNLSAVFLPVMRAIRSRNFTQLNQVCAPLESKFFVLLRKFQLILFRLILRDIFTQLFSSTSRRIDLSVISTVASFCGYHEETHFIGANLIKNGMISGYLSYEEQALVLTGANPFPVPPFSPSF